MKSCGMVKRHWVLALVLPTSLLGLAPTVSYGRFETATFGVFVGTSPCDAAVRPSLGIHQTTDCELVKWNLVLYDDPDTGTPTTYTLVCDYGPPQQGTNGLSAGAGRTQRQGKWRFARGTRADPDASVYQLDPGEPGCLSFARVGPHLLHLLDREGSPMVGNAGWSYTLNRSAGRAKQPEPSPTIPVAKSGFEAVGEAPASASGAAAIAFVGRSPGLDAARHPKLKWDLTLHRDPGTLVPTTFRIKGTLYRARDLEGRWRMTRGAEVSPDAQVIELESDDPEVRLMFLQLDENVLLFLDSERNLLVGNGDFSFTLNSAEVLHEQ